MNKKQNNWLFWVLQIIGWTFVALAMYYLFYKPKVHEFRLIFLMFLSYVFGFLMTSFVLRYFYRYLRKNVKSVKWLIVIVIFLVLIFVPTWYFVDMCISMIWWPEKDIKSFWENLSFLRFFRINYNMYLVYYTWTSLYFSIKYWIEWQDEKKRSEEAFLLAQKAQLQILRYQLNPHFLFNSLNSIKALIDEDGKSAKKMITELSEFLRFSLINQDIAFRPLKEELDALKLYLGIEKRRYEEKLKIVYDISPDTEKLPVLGLLIHPIIENAVKYGMKTSSMPLELLIKSFQKDGFLTIEICNSGEWFVQGGSHSYYGTGTGLENVKKRLKNAYKNNFVFQIDKMDNKVCVKIAMDTNEQKN